MTVAAGASLSTRYHNLLLHYKFNNIIFQSWQDDQLDNSI